MTRKAARVSRVRALRDHRLRPARLTKFMVGAGSPVLVLVSVKWCAVVRFSRMDGVPWIG
jgi:hypothetical protein